VHVRTTAGRIANVVASENATMSAEPGAPAEAAANEALTLLRFRPSTVDFQFGERGMRLLAALRLTNAGGIHVEAAVPEDSQPLTERPLSGHIAMDLPDLSFLGQLAPDVGHFEGRLAGDMRLAGSIVNPQARGRVALTNALAVLNGPGLRVKNIQATLTGAGRSDIHLEASARSGGGTLNVGGQLMFASKGAPRTNIHIRGQNFQVFNTVDARVFASPDLKVMTRKGSVNITGKVRVPRAEITPKQLPASAVTVSSDQVIIQPGDEARQVKEAVGPKVYARIHLILVGNPRDLGEDDLADELTKPTVYIDAFGLSAGFTGELLIIEEPGEPTKGSGELQIVDGTYRAYGQNLTIEKGRILFPGGPITKPGLEVRAVRGDLKRVRVGVYVRGSLRQPTFELFSAPSMTQQEQLAYLVLGHPMGELSGGAGSLLAGAALALGLKGGNYLAEHLGTKLGLDEVGIESGPSEGNGEGEQASLVIGKYLSPRLYVSYGLGLLQPISTLRLQYTITKRLQVVTQSSGSQSGGDLIYTIERGK
ncbi:MAG: translocation/assembly module TamB domain-containing protein, partial [Pseudomonadota bacterium]|nr:translocation/assembly module TamB domain-containing protein [Pseudomonadota bacterium]